MTVSLCRHNNSILQVTKFEEVCLQARAEDRKWRSRELNQARSKPDIVDRPIRTACTFVHHYNSTQLCSTETVFLIFPFLQTNIILNIPLPPDQHHISASGGNGGGGDKHDEQSLKNKLNLSFAVNDDATLLGFFLLPLVLRNSVEEILTTTRVLYVLHTDVDPLGQDATPVNIRTITDITVPRRLWQTYKKGL